MTNPTTRHQPDAHGRFTAAPDQPCSTQVEQYHLGLRPTISSPAMQTYPFGDHADAELARWAM